MTIEILTASGAVFTRITVDADVVDDEFAHVQAMCGTEQAATWREYMMPEPTTDELWAALRSARNTKLAACDWTQMPDVPLTADAKTAWATYRQALRDLPENTTDPAAPVWPTVPE